MEYVDIAGIFQASRIALGTWAIGGWMWGGTEEKEAIRTIHKAVDLGINVIDTALVYGFGHSEKICGKAIKELGRRKDLIIATKTGLSWKDNGQVYRNAAKDQILQEVETSLNNLQLSEIDIYFVHWPDPLVPFEESAEAMLKLYQAGKIRSIGVSNYSPQMIKEFSKITPVHCVQPPYNLFEREAEEELIPFCRKNGLVTFGYGVLCRGLLSGKMHLNINFSGDDLRKVDPKFQEPAFSQYIKTVWELDKWSRDAHGKPVIELAARYALDRGIDVPLWGARKPDQLDPIKNMWDWQLTSRDFEIIEEILQKNIDEPIGPEFMAPPSRRKLIG
jgi:aryl-alcohol dehydrogenase-like predicted oxidoreductase